MQIKPGCTYKAEKKTRSDLNSFYQGMRNQSGPAVSVSNRRRSDSCCLIMVCEDSGPNPERHPLCLCLLPSRGAAFHLARWGGAVFPWGSAQRCTPAVSQHRTWSGAGGGSPEWMWRSGRLLLRRRAKHDLVFIPHKGYKVTHCALGSERYASRLAVASRAT